MIPKLRRFSRNIIYVVRTDRPVRVSFYIFSLLCLTLVSQGMMKYGDLFLTDVTTELYRTQVSFTGTVSPVGGIPRYNPNKEYDLDGVYSTAYLGNYVTWDGNDKVLSHDHGGSHLGVDIRGDVGSPVYAIANGVVVKASHGNTGFGNHIVLFHPDFPDFYDESKKADYYSSYSHLN